MISQTSLTGAAGEHLVMSEVLRRGQIAALAPEGVPNLDILVTSVDGRNLASLQVKTRLNKGTDGGWHMSKKHEDIVENRLFYAFVDLGKAQFSPTDDLLTGTKVYVVPSQIVATAVKESHRFWLDQPGKNGTKRNDSNFRRFMPDYSKVFGSLPNPFGAGWMDKFINAWHLLDEETPAEAQFPELIGWRYEQTV